MNHIRLYSLALIISLVFASCEKENTDTKSDATKVAYIVNYGNYSGSKSEISIYDIDTKTITNNAYKTANNIDFTSNIQSMAIFNDIAYFMSNNGDKIDIVSAKDLKATTNPVSTDIAKPRYFAASGNFAYITCWGNVNSDEWSTIPNSYIAKIDLTSKVVTKISLPGGPEGVVIVNNKLYTGLCTANKVAVMDLSNNVISYIEVSAVPQQFVVDYNGKLWASLVSKYSTPFPAEKLGLEIINTQNNTVESKVNFSEIGAEGYMHVSSDKKTIYVMGAEPWPGTKSTIYAVDAVTKTIGDSALISGENFYGFNVNPGNDNIYVLISPDATQNGTLKIYDKAGTLIDEENTGIAPSHVVFYDIVK